LEEKYHGRLTPSAKRDIARLQKGEHIDYVIGFVDFLGCKIDLSLRPFIPRSETEYWVEQAVVEVKPLHRFASSRFNLNQKVKCLDIFAGSGCIGVAVLKHVPRAHVDFGEKNKRLLSQIRLNAKKNGIAQTRYRIIQTNIFSGIKRRYDYIFANPPYIAESRKNKVQTSVLKHEPREALFAGKDGLGIIRPFLREAKKFLVKGGVVYLEFDSFQKSIIERYLKKLGYQRWQFFRDQYGKWRFVVIQKS
jgi:HemK-like putative methylase